MRKKIVIVMVVVLAMMATACSNKDSKDETNKKNNQTKGPKEEITISIAASLLDPMRQLAEEFESKEGIHVQLNSGSSGTLKKQIVEGAPSGLLFSANERYVDELIEEGFAKSTKKKTPIRNTIVFIKNNDVKLEEIQIDSASLDGVLSSLANYKGKYKIAIGNPDNVPAGQYAVEAMQNMNLYDFIQDEFILCKDVTAVRTYVEQGDADFGIIYKSDARDLKNSQILIEIPQQFYTEALYAVVPVEGYEKQKESEKFLDYIVSEHGLEVLNEYGFQTKN